MTNKAKQRRRTFAAHNHVGTRTAANEIAATVRQAEATPRPAIPPHTPTLPVERRHLDQRTLALTAVYTSSESHHDATRRSGPSYIDRDGRTGHQALAQYVHIEGTRFGNTTWRLSNDADGAKLRIVLEEPITREVIVDSFHRAICPLRIELSFNGGRTWVPHPDEESARMDLETTLNRASALLDDHRRSWNVARVFARTGEELVRYHRPDLEETPLYVHEAKILVAALESAIPGKAVVSTDTGPTVTVSYFVRGAPFALSAAFINDRVFSRAVSASEGANIWGVEQNDLNEEGARRAASQMIEWVRTQKFDTTVGLPNTVKCTITCIRVGCANRATWEDEAPTPVPGSNRLNHIRFHRQLPTAWLLAPLSSQLQIRGELLEHVKGICPECQTFDVVPGLMVRMTESDFVVETSDGAPYGRFRGHLRNWMPIVVGATATRTTLMTLGKMIDERFAQI